MVKKREYHTLHTPLCFLQLVLYLCVLPVLYSLENWCSVPKCPGSRHRRSATGTASSHFHVKSCDLHKDVQPKGQPKGPILFLQPLSQGQPYYMFTWSPIPLTVPSWQQSATFIKLCKSLLLCVASWTSTEYIFTARTRLWANFLYSVAKIHDIYVKETFIFCFIIAVRNWGM